MTPKKPKQKSGPNSHKGTKYLLETNSVDDEDLYWLDLHHYVQQNVKKTDYDVYSV